MCLRATVELYGDHHSVGPESEDLHAEFTRFPRAFRVGVELSLTIANVSARRAVLKGDHVHADAGVPVSSAAFRVVGHMKILTCRTRGRNASWRAFSSDL